MVKKYILTGAPGSGKSSINSELEISYGLRIIPEAAEDIIAFHQKRGNETPWELPDFQDQILKLQLERERKIDLYDGLIHIDNNLWNKLDYYKEPEVSIDRGILDQLAYYQLQGRPYSEALKAALQDPRHKYRRVFLIEVGNTCEKNSIRRENLEEAKRHQELHYKNYTNAGYKVEVIPFRESSKERAEMIMRIINDDNSKEWLKIISGGRKWN